MELKLVKVAQTREVEIRLNRTFMELKLGGTDYVGAAGGS